MISTWLKILFTIVFLAILALILHFILYPLYFKNLNSIFTYKLDTLVTARNYYSTISSIVTTLSSFAGVTLGLFYYFHKKENDEKSGRNERIRTRIKLIIDQLNTYDSLVAEVILKRVENEKDLEIVRGKISRCPEIINAILDNNEKLLNFKPDEVETIMKLFSFVEQCKYIMEEPHDTVSTVEIRDIKGTYIDLLQETRKVCYLKSE